MPYRNSKIPVRVCTEPKLRSLVKSELGGMCGRPLCSESNICCWHLHKYVGQDVLLIRCETCFPRKKSLLAQAWDKIKGWYKSGTD